MSRYIDADMLKACLNEEEFDTPDERWLPESDIVKMIDAIPTVDVVKGARFGDIEKILLEEIKFNKLILSMNNLSNSINQFCRGRIYQCEYLLHIINHNKYPFPKPVINTLEKQFKDAKYIR